MIRYKGIGKWNSRMRYFKKRINIQWKFKQEVLNKEQCWKDV
jgi:hypothetical protein